MLALASFVCQTFSGTGILTSSWGLLWETINLESRNLYNILGILSSLPHCKIDWLDYVFVLESRILALASDKVAHAFAARQEELVSACSGFG